MPDDRVNRHIKPPHLNSLRQDLWLLLPNHLHRLLVFTGERHFKLKCRIKVVFNGALAAARDKYQFSDISAVMPAVTAAWTAY